MATPQTGIFALGTMSHAYLELDARPGADAAAMVRLVASLREPRTTIGGVNLVAGFRPEIWAALVPGGTPVGLSGFTEPLVGADGYVLPATQHDVVVWLAGAAYDVVFDVSRGVAFALAEHATLAHEMVGWPYHRDLDLTGFIDGTENPTLVDATDAAIVEPGAPGEGGSVLLLQQWEHDGASWDSLSIENQEAAIGRTKLASDELNPRPQTSHVAMTDQDRFGRIFRRNIGYGTLTRHGTIFVGFSRDRRRLDAMLESMVARGGGRRDHLTDFAHAVTGAYYFVPSSEAVATFAAGSAP
ncbi:MAG TPA: Dyp-type peroxidase [Candidatus Limnocylindrales bacterium]|nr:Dyp-type peroxidase [Candidatus Limnocylindrales bacterium]